MAYRHLVWLFAAPFSGCTATGGDALHVEFEQDVAVVLDNDQVRQVKGGETVELPAKPLTVVRGDTHKSMILLPIPQEQGTMHIRLPRAGDRQGGGEGDVSEASSALNHVARQIVEIQSLLLDKRPDEALARIQVVREKYPAFTYIRFLEASCFAVKDDMERARQIAESALKEFPDDIAGRQFLSDLASDPEVKDKSGDNSEDGSATKESH